MRLSSISLRNIRSYVDLTLEFTEGITILSGDIGTGKSTILTAVEFALFGLSRSDLVGQALLRHGEDAGEVTLRFTIGDQEYAIHRTLKRTRQGITQDAGWYEEDGVRTPLTASELRERIFTILGYPLNHLGRQRNTLYRFTIYTPQEELKSILLEKPEERVEVIRRIFGVDTYRVARENAQNVARTLKEHAQALKSEVERLDEELAQIAAKREGSLATLAQRAVITEQLRQAHAGVMSLEAAHTKAQAESARIESQMQVLAMQARERMNRTKEVERFTRIVQEKGEHLAAHKGTVGETERKATELAALVATPAEALTARTLTLRKELDALRQEEGKLAAMHEHCLPLRVGAGTICPTCQQPVTEAHLQAVHSGLEAKRSAIQTKRARIAEDIRVREEELTSSMGAMEHVRQLTSVRERLEGQKKLVESSQQMYDDARKRLAEEQAALAALPPAQDTASIAALRSAAATTLEEAARSLSKARKDTLDLERKNAMLDAEERVLKDIDERQTTMKLARTEKEAQHERTERYRAWLLERFTPFTSAVEERVLASVYVTFSQAFSDWVRRLLEDDTLTTRLDSSFGPMVEQHGYETSAGFLSGGERTALSLGYRLALVHTIHALLPHLGTAGLVILDEPTEGFSVEQLDKLRDVLSSLMMEQIILVSHDPQMESLADTVIRVHKSASGSIAEAV